MTNTTRCAVRAAERPVMATKVSLTLDDSLSLEQFFELKVLIKDAFGEFAARRTPARDYVENRYPGNDYYPDREAKVAQVERRCQLARKLGAAADDTLLCTRTAEQQLFEQMLAHELTHKAAGNPPDLVTLEQMLRRLFQ